jgi:1,4-dihydroxy-2-naphthoate polyprenyltransferase
VATANAPARWSVWVTGARPRTLGAALAPVVVGTSAAHADGADVSWVRAALALVVALGLQIGVNFANDVSDGVRGVDAHRVGPPRLTASGLASPAAVRAAAVLAFAVAAVAGLALAILVEPWLLALGALAIAAAVLYAGGPRPYAGLGLGEVMVLAYFGFVATAGSAYVQAERVPAVAWWGSLVVGLLACGILLANNLRDARTDAATGKRTLAVRLGSDRTRRLYAGCVAGAFVAVIPIGIAAPPALAALAAVPLAVRPVRLVLTSDDGPSLVQALVATARLELVVALLIGVGLWLV